MIHFVNYINIFFRLDRGLYEASVLSTSVFDDYKSFQMVCSELCGQLYLIIAQYFYLSVFNNNSKSSFSDMVIIMLLYTYSYIQW